MNSKSLGPLKSCLGLLAAVLLVHAAPSRAHAGFPGQVLPLPALTFFNIGGGVSGDRRDLSVTEQCGLVGVELRRSSEPGHAQYVSLENVSGDIHRIVVTRRDGSCQFKYLSTARQCDNTGIDTYHSDDNSGRQHWSIQRDPVTGYVKVFNGWRARNCNPAPSILSTSSDGSVVDLWTRDDGSGRQKWRLSAP